MTGILRSFGGPIVTIGMTWYMIRQCRKPNGWPGRLIASVMNQSHSGLTLWGLEHVQINRQDAVLDVGCGGGRTLQRLANMADLGKVHGVDYSNASVAASRSLNRDGIESGRIAIQNAAVSCLPFPDDSFDVVTAVETHYYWPDLSGDVQEIRRVLKPGGSLLIVAESYRGGALGVLYGVVMKPLGGTLLTSDEHRDLLVNAGYADVQVFLKPAKGWICATGRKP
jgi:SAM-dependent methyltransferase